MIMILPSAHLFEVAHAEAGRSSLAHSLPVVAIWGCHQVESLGVDPSTEKLVEELGFGQVGPWTWRGVQHGSGRCQHYYGSDSVTTVAMQQGAH